MTPLNPEQVQNTAQHLLALLDRDDVSIPGSLAEGVVSGKSLLRGILAGGLVVCQVDSPDAPPADKPPATPKKAPRKKAA